MRVLLAEDRSALRIALAEALERAGFDVLQAPEGAVAMELVQKGGYECAVFDLKMPVYSGIQLLKASKEKHPDVPIILLTAYSSVETAVTAMQDGAFTYLAKPISASLLIDEVNRALNSSKGNTGNLTDGETPEKSPAFRRICGNSSLIKSVREKAARIAVTDTTCLLHGETGVGKELFARAIHDASERSNGPFVPVNCAAIPETLLENELFGHEKGAYTGAGDRSQGKFEYACGGTIFLDEIGEMGISLQAKLLRVLEDHSFTRIGGTKPVSADIRLICATNRDLGTLVDMNAFRRDLYYRLNVFPIRIPPLRERREDIPLLSEYFIRRFRSELDLPALSIAPEAVRWLEARPWPGNIRELMNDIKRAAILASGDGVIDSKLLKREQHSLEIDGESPEAFESINDPREWLRAEEAWRVTEVLDRCNGDRAEAAEILGISKTRLKKICENRETEGKETTNHGDS